MTLSSAIRPTSVADFVGRAPDKSGERESADADTKEGSDDAYLPSEPHEISPPSEDEPRTDISDTVKFAMNMGNYLNKGISELSAKRERLIIQLNLLLRKRASLGIEQETIPIEQAAGEYCDEMDSIYQKVALELSEIRRERSIVAGEVEKLLRLLNCPEMAQHISNQALRDCAPSFSNGKYYLRRPGPKSNTCVHVSSCTARQPHEHHEQEAAKVKRHG